MLFQMRRDAYKGKMKKSRFWFLLTVAALMSTLLMGQVGPWASAEPDSGSSQSHVAGAPGGGEEPAKIFLDGVAGDDSNDGSTTNRAVKTFQKAKELSQANPKVGQIVVVGTVPVSGNIDLSGTGATLVRGEGFNDYLLTVSTSAALTNVIVDGNSQANSAIKQALIHVPQGSTLDIGEGVVLRNNKIQTVEGDSRRGGAIYAQSANINMAGGVIEDNRANDGGGIYLVQSTMNFSGGVVRNNLAERVFDADSYRTSGGGICVDKGSTLNMSNSAIVENNRSEEVGGGISVGSREWGPTNILNMAGGAVRNNTSEATGGGIFIQAKYFSGGASKAFITAGKITGNKMLGTGKTNKAFGGGGIYVNGANELYGANGANGELYLKNAVVTNNTSDFEGSGYAACPISTTKIYVNDGVALYGNSRSDGSRAAEEIYVLSSQKYGLHSGVPEYKLSQRMLGGVANLWKQADGSFLPTNLYEGKLENDGDHLSLHTDEVGNELTQKLGLVIISGNYSATRGGGIGSNGSVEFGTSGETTEVKVTKAWDDEENSSGLRPATVEVDLIATVEGAQYVVETRVLSEDNSWTTTFSDLPTVAGGKEIAYSVKEANVAEGYVTKLSGDAAAGFVLTNTLQPQFVEVSGSKTWDDAGDEQSRPSSITIRLFADGVEIDSQSVTAESDWTWKFADLPKYDEGRSIVYTVKEDAVDGYTSVVSGYDITNTRVPNTPPPSTPPTPSTTPPPPSTPPSRNLPKTGSSAAFTLLTALALPVGIALFARRRREDS